MIKTAAKSAKTLAQQIAKQIAQEPIEILKTARSQVAGTESVGRPENKPPTLSEPPEPGEAKQKEQVDKLKSARRIEALNRELTDIEKQDKFKELQKRISEGEEISLEEYPDLTIEQKQVLKAQMEAVKNQQLVSSEKPLVEPQAHRGRQLFNFGKKTAMKREQTHVEKIVPPSG